MAIMAPPPGPERVAQAQVIVVGRVVALEPKDVSAQQFPKAPQNINYRIAVVSVTEAIKGIKSEKTIRVGFIPPPQINPVPPGGGVRPFIRRPFNPGFTVGQDGLFFLNKHHQESFYLAPQYFNFISAQAPNFKQEVTLTKLTIRLGDNLAAGLKSKDAEERFMSAALLIQKYRFARGLVVKSEPIDAAESKLILTTLLEANWKDQGNPNPWMAFNQLGLTPKDGWTFPQGRVTIEDLHKAAQTWLREHAATYRIQRVVVQPFKGPVIRPGGPIRPGIQPLPVQPVPPGAVPVPGVRIQPAPAVLPAVPAVPPRN
jgi:hypothetical protein